jgi:signal transduction histidine kinase
MVERSPLLSRTLSVSIVVLALLGFYLASLYSYLLFHSLAEIFSVVVACGIFMVAWNARRFLDNDYLLFLGIAYLFVAGLDMAHTLAYQGMGVFRGYTANLATQLWIASRYVESLSLLIAPLFLRRRLNTHIALLGYAVVFSLLLVSIFYWQIFPDCYLEGIGLTDFKKISEYIISLILATAIAMLLQRRAAFDPGVLRLLILAIAMTIAAELAFTRYASVYGLSNLIGHFFKLVSFYLIYKAIIATGLVKPYLLMFRDLKDSEDALRQYNLELRARNEELDAFAHTVAHDLRNPLALIIGSARLLNSDDAHKLDKAIDERLQAIIQTAFKMSSIIDELLLLAEVRKLKAQAVALEMGAIVAEAQQTLAHLIESSAAEITVPDAWPAALGYGPWIEQVWINYINNSIKYGGQPPRLELGATRQPDGMVRFWVRDNGPGLAPEDQASLFTPFTRLDQVRATGYGLGLSIVKRIVEKLDGQVGIESESGQGSTFFFTLPAVD